ncbi:MAG: lytic transglycosylase domain-containing protein [Pseudomonadota bacterium]
MSLFQVRFLIVWVAMAMAMCGGVARAAVNVYGFVDGGRVSVIYADMQPADRRYVLYKKGGPGQFAQIPDAPAGAAGLKPTQYSGHILAAAQETKVHPALIHAVISAESGYNPSARSKAGAVGLMQLMPGTAKRFGVQDPLDPAQNIHGGARYLRALQVMFDNNLQLVLAAYNAGENAVKKYGRRIPPYRETVAYVPKVMQLYRKSRLAS